MKLQRIVLGAVLALAVGVGDLRAQRVGLQLDWGSDADLGLGARLEANARLASTGAFSRSWFIGSFDYFFDGTPYHIDVKLAGLLRMSVFTSVAGFMAYLTARQRKTMAKLAATNVELEKSYEEITALRGILPICVHCKQIRNDQGLWERVEKYISEHSEARFSHGVCPECCRKHYPEVFGAQ